MPDLPASSKPAGRMSGCRRRIQNLEDFESAIHECFVPLARATSVHRTPSIALKTWLG